MSDNTPIQVEVEEPDVFPLPITVKVTMTYRQWCDLLEHIRVRPGEIPVMPDERWLFNDAVRKRLDNFEFRLNPYSK